MHVAHSVHAALGPPHGRKGPKNSSLTSFCEPDLVENAPDGISAAGPLNESEFLLWEAMIEGPPDSPYDGGVFRAQLK